MVKMSGKIKTLSKIYRYATSRKIAAPCPHLQPC